MMLLLCYAVELPSNEFDGWHEKPVKTGSGPGHIQHVLTCFEYQAANSFAAMSNEFDAWYEKPVKTGYAHNQHVLTCFE